MLSLSLGAIAKQIDKLLYSYFIVLLALAFLPLFGEEIADTSVTHSIKKEKIPNVPVFPLNYKDEALKCYPVRYINKNFYEREIEYVCLRKDIKVTDGKINDVVEDGEATGQEETDRMREEVKNKQNMGATYTVHIPERNARNIWKASSIASRQLKSGFFQNHLRWLLPAKLYISARPQYSGTSDNEGMKLRDGGSRGGFFYYYQFDNELELTFQHESKINWSDISSFVNVSNNSDSSRRLQYVNIAKGNKAILVGKYWSPYYDIAGMTDHFLAYGSESSGAFNDSGDGGASGTGRPDGTLQVSTESEDGFSVKLQYQVPHNPNDGINSEYSYGFGGNIIYKGWSDVKVGASVVYNKFTDITPEMLAIGIDGNDLSAIAGVSYRWEDLSVNAVLSYTRNHMNDDQGIYFDGLGAELYMRYDFGDSIRFACGGNWLDPRDSDYKGEYDLRKSIFSLQYTFGRKTFDDLVYLEVAIPKGYLANGDKLGSSVAFGMRYLFNLW